MKVELIAGKLKREFEFTHAERILNSKMNKGEWKLPNDSKFEFKDHELRIKGNKKKAGKTKVSGAD